MTPPPVFGARWSEVHETDRSRFLLWVQFGYVELDHAFSEADLKAFYERLNYGGTAHTPADRARLSL